MPMTGGYRRTPVMQVGADIYCDTQCIMRELERRFPQPSLLPGGYQGLTWGSAMWTDRPFFQNTVNLVFGSLADKVPADFIADREKLRGAKFDVAAMTSAIPQMRDQFRAHLSWIDTQLGDERTWLAGETPSLYDINAYMNLWYVRARTSAECRSELLAESSTTLAPGPRRLRAPSATASRTEMTTAEALAIASKADSRDRRTARSQRSQRPQGRRQGRGHAGRLRQDPRGRRDRRTVAAAHRDPPPGSPGRRRCRALSSRRLSGPAGLASCVAAREPSDNVRVISSCPGPTPKRHRATARA